MAERILLEVISKVLSVVFPFEPWQVEGFSRPRQTNNDDKLSHEIVFWELGVRLLRLNNSGKLFYFLPKLPVGLYPCP